MTKPNRHQNQNKRREQWYLAPWGYSAGNAWCEMQRRMPLMPGKSCCMRHGNRTCGPRLKNASGHKHFGARTKADEERPCG